jgi:lysozyme
MSSNRIQGIDVSHYQGNIDWTKVKSAGMAFAYTKATESTSSTDSQFSVNWPAIKSAGLLRGAYHFFHGDQDGTAQANHFLDVVGNLSGDLPPVIDIESTSNGSDSQIVSGVQAWLDVVQQSAGIVPMIYTVASFWNDHLNSSFGNYPLWIANYGVSSPKLPTGWSNWNFWQYSQSGTVNGISGNVDMDYFNGSMDQLQAFAGSSATSQPDSGSATVTDSSATDSSTPSSGGGGGYTYIVKSGDTLTGIAASFNTTVADLQQANNIQNPDDISVGQILTIPS